MSKRTDQNNYPLSGRKVEKW